MIEDQHICGECGTNFSGSRREFCSLACRRRRELRRARWDRIYDLLVADTLNPWPSFTTPEAAQQLLDSWLTKHPRP